MDKEGFPIFSEKDLRSINPRNTQKKLNGSKFFCNKRIASTLSVVLDGHDFKEWKVIRDILAHRVAPGRHIVAIAGDIHSVSWIKGIQINESTTSSRIKWLTNSISDLSHDLDRLTS